MWHWDEGRGLILMRILIYDVGVIGSLYVALFAEAGYDTSIYARGKRFEVLKMFMEIPFILIRRDTA